MFKIITARIILVLVVIYFAQFLVTENINGFPYAGTVKVRYHMPHVLNATANFDGVHYTNIASEGYHEFDQAFFPLYPLLTYILGMLFEGNHILAGIFISIVGTYLGCFFLYGILLHHYNKRKALGMVLFLLLFPTSFYTQIVYNEGLFLALLTGSIYFLYKKNMLIAGILAALASFSRIQGIFIVIPFFLHFYDVKLSLKHNLLHILKERMLLLLAPFVGLIVYMIYLQVTTGDPLYFFTSQPTFGAHRSTSLVLLPQVYFRYIKIFLTASFNFQYFVALLEVIFFTVSFITSTYVGYRAYKKKNLFELGLAIFSVAYIVLPTLTGTFSSLPRYSLLALAQYIAFVEVPNKKIRYGIIGIFVIFQIVLLSFFSRGYFIS